MNYFWQLKDELVEHPVLAVPCLAIKCVQKHQRLRQATICYAISEIVWQIVRTNRLFLRNTDGRETYLLYNWTRVPLEHVLDPFTPPLLLRNALWGMYVPRLVIMAKEHHDDVRNTLSPQTPLTIVQFWSGLRRSVKQISQNLFPRLCIGGHEESNLDDDISFI